MKKHLVKNLYPNHKLWDEQRKDSFNCNINHDILQEINNDIDDLILDHNISVEKYLLS